MGSLLIQEKEADCTSRRSQVEDNRRTRACGRRDGERVEEDERRHREEQGAAERGADTQMHNRALTSAASDASAPADHAAPEAGGDGEGEQRQ